MFSRTQRLPVGLCRMAATALLLAGCASPGPPHPPSLHLPQVVGDLSAQRVGDRVHLAWTTSRQTTDGDGIQGPVTAVLCRELRQPAPRPQGCQPVAQVGVQPGASSLDDVLPPELVAGPDRLIAYRVELRNQAGHGAGASAAAFALAGTGQAPAGPITLTAARTGILVRWAKTARGPQADAMELTRRLDAAGSAQPAKKRGASPLDAQAAPTEMRMLASGEDAGGVVDRTARYGDRYTYTAARVRRVTLEGHALEMRGQASPPATLLYLDTIAPVAPTGLVAIPLGDPGSGSALAIDLSWEVGPDDDVAGFVVYRSEAGGPFARLNPQPVAMPAWRDANVKPGARYRYRVTAVDHAGNESAPATAVEQTAPR